MTDLNIFKISTPGRVCLFGEHQDYLNLPVIPCAISLRISLEGKRRDDSIVHIDLPDINSEDTFSIDATLNYLRERDYFRSGINILRRAGYSFSRGLECNVHGEIPISAGTSSSSALVVSWINFLSHISDQGKVLTLEEIARIAHEAEVLEFNEPGGMMDQYSTSLGGILFLSFHPLLSVVSINAVSGNFVLGDSRSPKNTKEILSRVKNRVLNIVQRILKIHPGFSLHTISIGELDKFSKFLNKEEISWLKGTIRNRDITFEALELFRSKELDEKMFCSLLNEHQTILRDVLQISTPKIDKMLDAAMNAGAYGGKINGSGGGGCMFVYAPKNTEVVAEAVEKAGGKAYIVRVDEGTRVESMTEQK
ncbi:MAG: GHMP kinase [Chlorobiaceae bacterium]|nr:GHMP kinase [Chlorobiaceae bacterium]